MSAETILSIVLMASASLLCLALVIYLKNITKSIKKVENDITNLSSQLKPLIASATNLSEKINSITEEAKEQVQTVKGIVSDVKEHVDAVLALEEKVRRKIEEPLNGFARNISAIANGVNTFWNAYKHK